MTRAIFSLRRYQTADHTFEISCTVYHCGCFPHRRRRWIDKEAKENVPDEDGLGLRDGELDLGMYHTLKEVGSDAVRIIPKDLIMSHLAQKYIFFQFSHSDQRISGHAAPTTPKQYEVACAREDG